jgi:hypothetical protein
MAAATGRRTKKTKTNTPPVNTTPAATTERADWVITTQWQHNGRYVHPGTELTIDGERGRFRFVRFVVNSVGKEWIDVVGGPLGAKGHKTMRSFRPSRVHVVHRTTRMRTTRSTP